MRLSIKALALTTALLWAGCLFFVSIGHLLAPSYGDTFLETVSSVYPGSHPSVTIADVVVGTVYGFVDGAIGGAVFGWLYNALAPRSMT